MTLRSRIVPLALAALLIPSFAVAEGLGLRSWGPRAGYRVGENDFDQLVVGAHADLGDFVPNLRFAPNVELGFGDNATVVSIDPEIHYVFRDDPLGPDTFFYAGGGLGIHIFNFDVPETLDGFGVDDSDTDLKINLAAGVERQSSERLGYFGEFRVSFVDGTWVEFLGGLNLIP